VPGVRGAWRDAYSYDVVQPGDTHLETAVADTLLLVMPLPGSTCPPSAMTSTSPRTQQVHSTPLLHRGDYQERFHVVGIGL
jgi:hypothetical protein